MDFVEIWNVCTRKVIIKAVKGIFNSDKICRSYCDFYFGVTFFGTHCIWCPTHSHDLLTFSSKNCRMQQLWQLHQWIIQKRILSTTVMYFLTLYCKLNFQHCYQDITQVAIRYDIRNTDCLMELSTIDNRPHAQHATSTINNYETFANQFYWQ